MYEYRREHMEADGKLYVFVWVKLNSTSAPAKASTATQPFGGGSRPGILHIIWNKPTTGLDIDAAVTDPAAFNMNVDVMQMPPEYRRKDAEAWINTPPGIAWRGGLPVQLVQVSVSGH